MTYTLGPFQFIWEIRSQRIGYFILFLFSYTKNSDNNTYVCNYLYFTNLLSELYVTYNFLYIIIKIPVSLCNLPHHTSKGSRDYS